MDTRYQIPDANGMINGKWLMITIAKSEILEDFIPTITRKVMFLSGTRSPNR